MMSKSNTQSLGEVIREFLKTHHLEGKIDETKLLNAWEDVVGNLIAKHTQKLYIKNKVLFAKVDSSVIKHEMMFAKEKIISSLNKATGKAVIKDICFI